jgi:hypothetical protein
MVKPEDKGLYKLWWEYLKRSERYKKYLEWEQSFKSKEETPLPADLEPYHQPLWNMARHFGDVHAQSFAEWWEGELDNNLPSPFFPYYSEPGKRISDARIAMEREIDRVWRGFRRNNGRDPKSEELIHGLKELMAQRADRRLYIVVEFLHGPTEEIIQELREVLSQKKKEPGTKKAAFEFKGAEGKPTSVEPRVDELQRYLKVYDLRKKGLTFPQIIEKVGTPVQREIFSKLKRGELLSTVNSDHPQNIRRSYLRDLQKARKIIENVERGFFPGSY